MNSAYDAKFLSYCDWGYVPSFFQRKTPLKVMSTLKVDFEKRSKASYELNLPDVSNYNFIQISIKGLQADAGPEPNHFSLTPFDDSSPNARIDFKKKKKMGIQKVHVGACPQWFMNQNKSWVLSAQDPFELESVVLSNEEIL